MTKFEPLTSPTMVDFYNIFELDGVKYIHIFGYAYESDVYWANMECSNFIEPLESFIANVKKNNDTYVDEVFEGLSQYQSEHTASSILDVINHYFDGKPADYILPYEEITMDSPCGNYVTY